MLGTGLLIFFLLIASAASAQAVGTQTAPSPYVIFWNDLLRNAAASHSPSAEEIAAAGSPVSQPGAAAVAEARPAIRKALLNPDHAVRACALTALTGLELQPVALATGESQPAQAADPAPAMKDISLAPLPGPGIFQPEVAAALAPAIPEIAESLNDELPENRILAATVLGGFAPEAPPAAYPPLLGYLGRSDGIGPTGEAVVDDLLSFRPMSAVNAEALAAYVRRSDHTAESRAGLIRSVSNHAIHHRSVDTALLTYLDNDDPTVRARLIALLPQLDLAPEVYADTHARIALVAIDSQQDAQVVSAAKAILACWSKAPTPSGCPVP